MNKIKHYNPRSIKIEGYNNIKYLACGGNSFVYSAEKDGKKFAIKIINKELKGRDLIRYLNEVEFEKEQDCPYIVKIIENGEIEIFNNTKKTSIKRLFYIMPFYKKNFRDLCNNQHNTGVELLKYYDNICSALEYAHSYNKGKVKGVFHRDIKPENILYDFEKDICLLSDFGIAHFNNASSITTYSEKLANFQYAAPEQRNRKGKVGKYTDIFSMGLILNEIFTHNIPVGIGYKTIYSVEPMLGKLDDIVASMIVDDPNRRVHFIGTIRNKIKYYLSKYNDEKESVIDLVNDLINDKSLIDVVIRDIIVGDRFAIIDILPRNLNLNYHYNISYKLDDNVLNSYFILKEYDEINKKINYETPNIIAESDIENWSSIDKDEFNAFRKELSNIPTIQMESIKAMILRNLRNLKDYHAHEYIDTFRRKYKDFIADNINNPILFCSEIINKLRNRGYILNSNLYSFIEKISFSSINMKSDYMYMKDKEYELNNVLQHKFGCSYIDEKNSVTIIFDDEISKNKMEKMVYNSKCNELKQNIDIDDVYDAFIAEDDHFCYMDSYNFYYVLCNKVLKIEIDF